MPKGIPKNKEPKTEVGPEAVAIDGSARVKKTRKPKAKSVAVDPFNTPLSEMPIKLRLSTCASLLLLLDIIDGATHKSISNKINKL